MNETKHSALTKAVHDGLKRILGDAPDPRALTEALRHLAKWRSVLVANTIQARDGTDILHGPFRGMHYAVPAAEGSRAARLLGGYEASLVPVIETIIKRKYGLIIDVGCAEGYYAVGLARRIPKARVLAHDASEKAQALCREMALANGVADRVQVGGIMGHADFDLCKTRRAVVICDIEGAEDDLLDPIRAPGLAHADILVESHECMKPGLTQRLKDRFAATHSVREIGRSLDDGGFPAWMEELSDIDRLIALWEWRIGPTPWLWMEKL
jgi:SAM-dependent methyltransferase